MEADAMRRLPQSAGSVQMPFPRPQIDIGWRRHLGDLSSKSTPSLWPGARLAGFDLSSEARGDLQFPVWDGGVCLHELTSPLSVTVRALERNLIAHAPRAAEDLGGSPGAILGSIFFSLSEMSFSP